MTEQEAIVYMNSHDHYLEELPEEFHTKEFVLSLMNEHNIHLLIDELDDCGLVDCDIALSWCIRYGINKLHRIDYHFGSVLPKNELEKLKVTLDLLGALE